jgi:hypothetical protein
MRRPVYGGRAPIAKEIAGGPLWGARLPGQNDTSRERDNELARIRSWVNAAQPRNESSPRFLARFV